MRDDLEQRIRSERIGSDIFWHTIATLGKQKTLSHEFIRRSIGDLTDPLEIILLIQEAFSIDRERMEEYISELKRQSNTSNVNENRSNRIHLGLPFIQAEFYSELQQIMLSSLLVQRDHSMTDVLTGLPNRRSFEYDLIKQVARTNRRGEGYSFILMYIDIDHFKTVNDRYGHKIGDDVLRRVSDLIKDSVRTEDSLYRIGGEEFALICPNTEISGGIIVADKILNICRNNGINISYNGTQTSLNKTVSIGLVLYPYEGYSRAPLSTKEAMGHFYQAELDKVKLFADASLYYSKQDGRDRLTIYTHGMENLLVRERN